MVGNKVQHRGNGELKFDRFAARCSRFGPEGQASASARTVSWTSRSRRDRIADTLMLCDGEPKRT
eukprot:6190411-Pleurochrysis_carterae.AAC.1